MSNKQTMASILIADSSPLFREKMKQMIADNFDSILTSEAGNEQEVLNELSQHTFDILILELELSDGDGFNVFKKIMTIAPDIPVLVISMFTVQQYEESVLKEGAYGYISKANLSNDLISALKQIFRGKKYCSISTSSCLEYKVRNAGKDNQQ